MSKIHFTDQFLVGRFAYISTEDEIHSIPEGYYDVVFNDKTITMSDEQIKISWQYWLLYRLFKAPIISSQSAVTGLFKADTHREIGTFIIWEVFDQIESYGKYNIWQVNRAFLDIGNNLYNLTCSRLSKYVTSGSLYDLVELIEEPSIVKAKEVYMKTVIEANYYEPAVVAAIEAAYAVTYKVLYTNPEYLPDNAIKKLTICGLGSRGQIMQMVGPRGYVTDINDRPFFRPIDVGYLEGFSTAYDSIIETRSATRAAMMNTMPLESSEYFKRRVELGAGSTLKVVKMGENGCTGFHTVPYLVDEKDSVLLKGKYYMEDNIPVLIWGDITDLVGKVINIRSITGCGAENPQHVCHICLGKSYKTTPPYVNLGYSLSGPLCATISSQILGTKHLEVSNSGQTISLDAVSREWIEMRASKPNKLFIKPIHTRKNIILRIDKTYVKYISNVLHVDPKELSAPLISQIPLLGISSIDDSGNIIDGFSQMTLIVNDVGVNLTTEVLCHIKHHSWLPNKSYIDIVLRNWDNDMPIFDVPKRGLNIMNFFNTVEDFLDPERKTQDKITNYNTRGGAMAALVSILRRRLSTSTGDSFNFTQVEIFIRMLMVKNTSIKDYSLPRPSDEWEFAPLSDILRNRDLTTMLAFEEQARSFMDTHWLTREHKTSTALDYMIRM